MPKYPSTDLAYSLAPNGHGGGPALTTSTSRRRAPRTATLGEGNPIGAPKESYISGLFALGTEKGIFEEGTSDDPPLPCTYGDCEGPHPHHRLERAHRGAATPTPDVTRSSSRSAAASPSSARAYYQDEGWSQQADSRKVAVFSIQGWTDDLFPAVESFRMFKYLKRLDPRWPVEVARGRRGSLARAEQARDLAPAEQPGVPVAPVEHQRAAMSSRRPSRARPTVCGDYGAPQHLVGRTPEDLANGALTLQFGRAAPQGNAAAADPNGPATDAIAGEIVQPGEHVPPCPTARRSAATRSTRPRSRAPRRTSDSASCASRTSGRAAAAACWRRACSTSRPTAPSC